MPKAFYGRLLLSCFFIFGSSLAANAALAAADLPWDLSYQTALRDHLIADNEFMAFWPARYPRRPIHDKLADYAGDKIEASLLIERPDGHTGDPSATWFIKTRTSAQACSFHPKRLNEPCKQLDPARTEAFIREVMNFRPLTFKPSERNKIGEANGKPILLNYHGFVSVYADGRVLQRPVAIIEWGESALAVNEMQAAEAGRLSNAMAKAVLTAEELEKREAQIEQQQRKNAFNEAVRAGDIDRMRILADQGQAIEDPRNNEMPAIALAAGAGQKAAVDFLLRRGARIDATESAALKAAVQARNAGMVEYLLSRGAQVDPPKNALNAYGKIYATPLGVAVSLKDLSMAQLLIRHGANVNAPQSRPMIVAAALARDLPMMDLLLAKGANPNQIGEYEYATALMMLMKQSGNLSGWPKEEAKQQAILKTEEELEQVVRKLVAAGANVNYLDRACNTAYYEAVTRHSEGMQRLLVELGADPALHENCIARRRRAALYESENAEVKARDAITNETRKHLKNADFKSLEQLHRQLNKETERTPSGIWKLAVFYAQIRLYPNRVRNPEYWTFLEKMALDWKRQFPKSTVAPLFHAYLYWNRLLAIRGEGPRATVKEEDRRFVSAYAARANSLLYEVREENRDPEWHRAKIEIMPHTGMLSFMVEREARRAMAAAPAYHELYFASALYLLPRWEGSDELVDWLAQSAVAASSHKEGRALYARIYWYLDQMEYRGRVFANSLANWADMRAGFEDIIRMYPDPWNLNAYAYFACLAQDYKTMNTLLARIGDQLIFKAWNRDGAATFEECRRHGDADAPVLPDAASYGDFVFNAQYLRRIGRYEESLAALREAGKLEQKLGRTSMMTQYNLGMTLAEAGRHEEAIDAFTKGMPWQKDYYYVYWRRGLSYEALGRKAEAREDFETTARMIEASRNRKALVYAPGFVSAFRAKLRGYGLGQQYETLLPE